MRLLLPLLIPCLLSAIEQSGSVRAADQFIPGATVTARQGGAKVVAYTDESGRYTLDLTPGVWEIQVEMFGFKPKSQKLDVGATSDPIDWTLELPRAGETTAAPVPDPRPPAPAVSAPTPDPRPPTPAAAPPPRPPLRAPRGP